MTIARRRTRVRRMWRCALALLLASSVSALAQSAPKHYLSTASNNSTLIIARPSLLKMLSISNTTATLYYVKFYNKVTAPTCGTDVPVLTLPAPASAAGGAPVSPNLSDGLLFPLGIGFCITAGLADNDNTSAATGVALDVGVTAR